MITRRGAGLLLAAVALFALASVTRVGWLLLFDAVLWGTLLIGGVMPWLFIGRLRLHRRVASWDGNDVGPMEGQAVELEIKVHNRGLLPAVFAAVRHRWPKSTTQFDSQRLVMAWLGRHEQLLAHTRVVFERRGLHRLPRSRVETSVPFGMFRRSKRAGDPLEVLVLPKVLSMGRMDLLEGIGADTERPLHARIGDQAMGSRPYASGDPKHHIHWPNTARLAFPQVKEFESMTHRSLAIAIDVGSGRRERKGRQEALDHAVTLAASVGDMVLKAGGAVSLHLGDWQAETSDRRQLLERLAILEESSLDEGNALARLGESRIAHSAVLAIVRAGDDDWASTLVRLANIQRTVAAVVLRGFGSDEGMPSEAGRLHRAGIVVHECLPGGLVSTLGALEGRYHRSTPAEFDTATSRR